MQTKFHVPNLSTCECVKNRFKRRYWLVTTTSKNRLVKIRAIQGGRQVHLEISVRLYDEQLQK